ncbi:MAG: hypothetical protein ACOYO0_01800 [Sandarakinorhabdus sp.]
MPQDIGQTPMTRHARERCQQRSIPEEIIDLLLDFACSTYCGNGCERYAFCRRSWRKAAQALGKNVASMEHFRHAYLVLAGDGSVVTAGWRH